MAQIILVWETLNIIHSVQYGNGCVKCQPMKSTPLFVESFLFDRHALLTCARPSLDLIDFVTQLWLQECLPVPPSSNLLET